MTMEVDTKHVYLPAFLSWLLPFLASMVFFAPSEPTGAVKLWVDRDTFKTSMVVIASLVSAPLFHHSFKLYPNKAIMMSFLYLWVNLVLDVLILLPMSGMSFEEYINDIGARYFAIPVWGYFVDSLYTHREWAPQSNYDGKHIPTLYSPLVFLLPWILSHSAAFKGLADPSSSSSSSSMGKGAPPPPAPLVIDEHLYESIMVVIEVVAFVHFFLKSLGKSPLPRVSLYIAFIFATTCLALDVTFNDQGIVFKADGTPFTAWTLVKFYLFKLGSARRVVFLVLGGLGWFVLKFVEEERGSNNVAMMEGKKIKGE